MLLVLLIASRRACSPKTCLIAFVSAASPSSVLVPWALTYCTSSGLSFASLRAIRIAIAAPAPLGCGAVMWWASAVLPTPSISA